MASFPRDIYVRRVLSGSSERRREVSFEGKIVSHLQAERWEARMSTKRSQSWALFFAKWAWEGDKMGGAQGDKVVIKQEGMDTKAVGISAKVAAPCIIRTALERGWIIFCQIMNSSMNGTSLG